MQYSTQKLSKLLLVGLLLVSSSAVGRGFTCTSTEFEIVVPHLFVALSFISILSSFAPQADKTNPLNTIKTNNTYKRYYKS